MLATIKTSLRFIRDNKKPVVCTGFFYLVFTYPLRFFYRAYHKLTVKAEEIFWETRNKGFLNIAVLTLRMLL